MNGWVRYAFVVTVCSLLAVPKVAEAQESDGKQGVVVGTGTFTSFVEDMDQSLNFYKEALGMAVPELPESGSRPYNPKNVQLFAMFDIQGAKERHQSASIPDTNVRLEMMEIQEVPHKVIPLRVQDPGSAMPILIVRDIDALLARVKKAQAEIVTQGGEPVLFDNGTRSVLIRDVDGRFIELRQPPAVSASGSFSNGGIVGMRLSLAVEDLERTTEIYRDVLGFTVESAVDADPALQKLTNLPGLEARRSVAYLAGSSLLIEFVEYRAVDRRPLAMNIQDRGAARLQIRAENIDQLLVAMQDAGLKVHSEGGVATPIPPNFKGALVADSNNFFLTPFASCDDCAPGLQSTRH